MPTKVLIPTRGGVSIPVNVTRVIGAVTTGSQRVTSANLQQLANVDIVTNGLEDGFTIVYDEGTGKWVAQASTVGNLDGGTY
jgi:hypothetical protein